MVKGCRTCVDEVVDAESSDSPHLLPAAVCSSALIVVLLLGVFYLIYKRVNGVVSVKSSLTAVISIQPSSDQYDHTAALKDFSSGYSGSGSGE